MTRSTHQLVEMGLMVSLASVLSQIALVHWPQGGSVTLGASIPIWAVARRYGTSSGVLAGVSLGIVNLLFGGAVIHPLQGALDYPMAFGALGLAGWPISASLGIALSAAVRFACHCIAGLMFFASYAPAGFDPTMYVLLYNGSLVLPDTLIAMWGFHKMSVRIPGLIEAADGVDPRRRTRSSGEDLS